MQNYVWISVFVAVCAPLYGFDMGGKLNTHNYFGECDKIDAANKQEFKYYIERTNQDNASERIDQTCKALQAHQDNVIGQKEAIFSAFRNKYNISDDWWNYCRNISHTLQAYRKQNMWRSCDNFVHCKLVPQWFMSMLKKELVDIGFNPHQIDIYHNEQISMITTQTQVNWYRGNEKIEINLVGPGKIGINCNELDASQSDVEEGRCMLLAHMMKFSEISNIVPILRTFGISVYEEDDMALTRLAWEQALFAVALRNRSNVYYIKELCKTLKLSFCSLEQYKQLSSIELCWKILRWLDRYSDNTDHGIPLLLKAQDGDITEVNNLIAKGMVVSKNAIESVCDQSPVKLLLQKTYDEQQCCVCKQHPEDMRDIPCANEYLHDFICRQCYNNLDKNDMNQKICPLCQSGCYSYNKITL